jgi:structural maintenance of chromosome 1
MDAISFVLGVQSSQLRSANLKDLIYRGSALQLDADENAQEVAPVTTSGALVSALYQDDQKKRTLLTRTYAPAIFKFP